MRFFGRLAFHLQTRFAQTVQNLQVTDVLEVLHDVLRDLRTHIFDGAELFGGRPLEAVYRVVTACNLLRRRLAHHPYSERKEHTRPRHLFGGFDTVQNVLRTLLAQPFLRRDILQAQVVNVGDVMQQPFLIEQVNRLFAKTVDVHRFATYEMLDLPFYLRRTTGLVRASPSCLAFHPHQCRPALRASRGENKVLMVLKVFRVLRVLKVPLCPPCYLRYNLSTFFYPYLVARTDVELFDEVFVMQRRALDDSAG